MHTIWTPQLNPNKPKYRALYEALDGAIRKGELNADDKLPPIREMAYQLGITAATVVRAYQMGIEAGWLEARKGDGTYVCPSKLRNVNTSLYQFNPEDGYNLHNRSVPEVGQTKLLNELVLEIAQKGAFHSHWYLTALQKVELRKLASSWLKTEGIEIEADELVHSQGANHGAALVALTLMQSKSKLVGMTEPVSYTGFLEKENFPNMKIHPVEVDDGGVCVESLANVADEKEVDIYFTSSVIHNPYATSLSEARMAQIAQVARECNFQIIDDIVHSHLVNLPQKTLRDFAPERVWTVTSLAKLGYPALNFGVVIPPKARLQELNGIKSAVDAQATTLQFPIVKALLGSPEFYRLRQVVREEVRARQDLVREILKGHKLIMADGAPFFWLKIPENIKPSQFSRALGERNVRGAPSDIFALTNETPNAIRLTLGGAHEREDFAAALCQVKEALKTRSAERVD